MEQDKKAFPFRSYSQLSEYLYEMNRNNEGPIDAYIVFTPDSFTKEYTQKSRTYFFPSDSKAFRSDACSSSIWADCADGTECGVRIDLYMKCDKPWKVQECGILTEEKDFPALKQKIYG